MSRVRAVSFDLDGTLFDHRGSALDGLSAFLHSMGIHLSPQAHALWFAAEGKQFERWRAGHITFQDQRRERLRSVLPRLGIHVPTDEAGLDDLFGRYSVEYRRAWRPFPDSAALLSRLRSRGLRIGLLTNGTQEQQLDKLRSVGLHDAFDAVCTSERIGAQKPELRAFVALADELGVRPDECLFIGDNPDNDIAGATAAGMRTLLVDRYGIHITGITSAVEEALISVG